MSSNDEEYAQDYHRGKKRRLQRACDVTDRKWLGTGARHVQTRTSTARTTKAPQTPPTQKVNESSYVDSLEARLEHSEALVRQLRAELANTHFAHSAQSSSANSPSSHNSPSDGPGESSATSHSNGNSDGNNGNKPLDGSTASLYIMRTALRSLASPEPPPHGDDLEHLEIARKLEKLSVGMMREHRFIGKSSGAMLVKAAIDLKADVKREEREASLSSYPSSHPAHSRESSLEDDEQGAKGKGAGDGSEDEDDVASWTSRRMKYWQWKPWENTTRRTNVFRFPPEALLNHLVEMYFAFPHVYLPLLHRQTFERGIGEGLHLRDDGFAATVLLVCAIGSRWSTSPTVAAAGLARGWEWFDQVPLVGNHLFGQATLYDLQYYCLAVLFLDGSSAPQACWTLIGVGIRLAQDIGVHRRKARIEVPTVESELYKRAFWVLVYLDRNISSGMGRTCAVQYDDFDIDPPIECDDEYWEHPTRPFQQPAGVPSRVTFFNTLMRLNHILSLSLKILYSLNKVRVFFSVNDAWEESAVAELDSSLNLWRDRIADHLRWDPARQDQVFFDQSVALHCAYYHLQILIHRPFIPMIRKSAPTGLPSLAICTSAARTCANIVDIQRQRNGNVPAVVNLPAVFTSAIVLLLNVWSGKRTGLVPDPSREMVNVHKCMEVVRLCEDRWQTAGLFWDILAELASVGQLPLPNGAQNGGGQHNGGQNNGGPPRTDGHHQHGAPCAGEDPTLPPLRGSNTIYPRCGHTPLDEESNARILLGSRGLRQTFDPPHPRPPIGSATGTLGPAPMEPSAFAPTPAPETWFPPQDPFAEPYTDPAQASRELGDMMNLIDSDTIAMWTNAPMGLEVDDWGTYFTNFSEITQAQTEMGMNGH
ncbi:fungal-specific transcription factor domain-containing protein [Mycena olivaceomarginata]|nr:fungal-specific transcription factor domain-containing protein [Mycena olivaceomarginata]